MRVSVYIHQSILDELSCYGELDDVVDKILTLGENGVIDLENKPPCRPRTDAKRVTIDIHNAYYITLVRSYPRNSSLVSLRRLLYWFVENDMCSLLSTVTVTDEELYNNLYGQLLDIVEQLTVLQQSIANVYSRRKYDKLEQLLQHTRQAIDLLEET